MTRQPSSFLIRVDGGGKGTITSIVTGERATFASFADLIRIIERLSGEDGSSPDKEEDHP